MKVDPYASGVLKPEHHERLVANLDHYAKDAGIQPMWIWTRLSAACGPHEADYITGFRRHRASGQVHGLCLTRKTPDAEPESRMAAMTGCLVRNFVRARVMTLGVVLDHLAN
jgi:hypothetical protein